MNKFKSVLILLLNPISPISVLVIGAILNVITNEKFAPNWVLSILTKNNITLLIYSSISWLVLTVIYTAWIKHSDDFKNEIFNLHRELEHKDRQIENNSGIIYHKYGELARFNQKQKLYEFLISFVDNNHIVQSAQIYKFTTKLNRSNDIIIRVKFEEGYTYENTEINSILQSYYRVPYNIYKEFNEVVKIWRLISEEIDYDSEDVIISIIEQLKNKADILLSTILDRLNSIDNANDIIDDQDPVLYRILLVLITLLYNDYSSGRVIEKILDDEKMEDFILAIKRTGLLGSILLKDDYLFKHTGVSSKNGRLYVAYYFTLYNEDYIMLVSLPTEELVNIEDFRWDKELVNLKKDFIERINSRL